MCPAENKVMPSKYAGRKVLSYEKADYYRQGGELVAGYSSYEQWLDMKKAEELNIFGKTDLAKMPEYTEKEIKEIYAAQDREEIRGANPRYWEDVKLGDELTPVVRGPVNDAELTAWHAAGHAHFISERLTRMMWEKMPPSPGWKGVNKWEFGQGFLKGKMNPKFRMARSALPIPGVWSWGSRRRHGFISCSRTGWETTDSCGSSAPRSGK